MYNERILESLLIVYYEYSIKSLSQEEKHLLELQLKKTSEPEQVQPLRMENEPFVGMWQDREDLKNSNGWVRQLRHSEWMS